LSDSSIKKIILGIDEAGRGSVIGPLVIGAVLADSNGIKIFEQSKVTDSKKLSPLARQELLQLVSEHALKTIKYNITPTEIDQALKDPTNNLNLLELQYMTKIIIETIPSTDIIIDAISTSDYCTNNIKLLLSKHALISSIKKPQEDTLLIKGVFQEKKFDSRLIAQNKADLNFKIVSAASIVAKVTRDLEIRKLEEKFNLETNILASGYPNDQLLPFLDTYKKEIKNRVFPFIRYNWNWDPLQEIFQGKRKKQKSIF